MSLTPQQIAEIATAAALAAVEAATRGTPSAIVPGEISEEGEPKRARSVPAVPKEPDEDELEAAAVAELEKQNAAKQGEVRELVERLIPLIMQPRHLEVFRWISGNNPERAITLILRNEIMRRTPDYREAMGGGGGSSRNLEALAERITVHK